MKKTHIAPLIYLGAWIIIVLAQSILIGRGATPDLAFWKAPEKYYSIWITDLYLILLFYLNYYLVLPALFQRKSFTTYGFFAGFSILLGLFLPMLLQGLFGWTTPYATQGTVGLSSTGFVGAIAMIAIGLSMKSIKQWLKLQEESTKHKETIASQQKQIAQLEQELTSFRTQKKSVQPTPGTPVEPTTL